MSALRLRERNQGFFRPLAPARESRPVSSAQTERTIQLQRTEKIKCQDDSRGQGWGVGLLKTAKYRHKKDVDRLLITQRKKEKRGGKRDRVAGSDNERLCKDVCCTFIPFPSRYFVLLGRS